MRATTTPIYRFRGLQTSAPWIALIAFFSLVAATIAQAAAGQLDQSFSNDGKTQISFLNQRNEAEDVLILPNGKIVTAGWVDTPDEVGLTRSKPNGNLDGTFSANGKTTVDFPATDYDYAEIVLKRPNGKLLVVCGIGGSGFDDWGFTQVNENGTVDSSYGTSGFATMSFDGPYSYIYSAAAAPGGNVVAVGEGENPANGDNYDLLVAMVNSDGDPLTTFGGGDGYEYYTHSEYANDVAVLENGKLLVVSRDVAPPGSDHDFMITRLKANGDIDTGFGNNGVRRTDFAGHHDEATSIGLQSNGKIIVGGRARKDNGDQAWALVRYTAGGNLDQNFGKNGRAITNFPPYHQDYIRDIEIQSNDRIVATGVVNFDEDMTAVRYLPNGKIDKSFSGDGKVTVPFVGVSQAEALDIGGGRIALGGYVQTVAKPADPTPDTSDIGLAVLKTS